MRKLITTFLLISLFFLLSCSSALKIAEVDPWLASKADIGSPSVDVSGKWQDAEYDYSKSGPQYWIHQVGGRSLGWGLGEFRQKETMLPASLGIMQSKVL